MKNLKRAAAFALALCISAVMFTGCGSKSSDDVNEKEIEQAAAQFEDEKGGNSDSENKVKEVDPFENLRVEFKGESPDAALEIKGGLNSIKYTADVEKGLKIGDTVTVTANLKSSYENKLKLTDTEKKFTVEGIDAFVEKLEDIPQDTLDKMDKTFRDGYANYLKAGTIKNIELAGNYVLTKKDASSLYNKKTRDFITVCTMYIRSMLM